VEEGIVAVIESSFYLPVGPRKTTQISLIQSQPRQIFEPDSSGIQAKSLTARVNLIVFVSFKLRPVLGNQTLIKFTFSRKLIECHAYL